MTAPTTRAENQTVLRRKSDRWITPSVIITAIIMGVILVLGVVYLVGDLIRTGTDPAVIVAVVTGTLGALLSAATTALQLAGRVQASRIEANTGRAG